MLQEANGAVGAHHGLARAFGGVISRARHRHTKLNSSRRRNRAVRRLQAPGRSAGPFHQGKLMRGGGCTRTSPTPTRVVFASGGRVADHGAKRERPISDSIKDCCAAASASRSAHHVPRANLLLFRRATRSSPRALDRGLLTRSNAARISIKHFDEVRRRASSAPYAPLRDPCPWTSTSARVGGLRNFLRSGAEGHRPGHSRLHGLPHVKDPATVKLLRTGMLEWGYQAQRLGHRVAKALGLTQASRAHPPATLGRPAVKAQVIHFFNRPMPGGLPKKTSRARLDIEDDKVVPVIAIRGAPGRVRAVFYFPGCGSERPVQPGGPGHPGHAVPPGRHHGAAPGICAAAIPRTRRASRTRAR